MRCLLLVSALISALLLSARESREADAKSDLGDNAALQYWQAVAVLPAYDQKEKELLEHWSEVALDSPTLKLLDNSRVMLIFVQRGTKKQRCEWGLDYNDGIEMLLPHLPKIRTLARLELLHARYLFSQKRWQLGVDEASSMFILARHAGHDPHIIAILVGNAVDYITIDLLARYLPEMDSAALEMVSARLDARPPAPALAQAVATEKEIACIWLGREMEKAERHKKGSWRHVLTRAASTDPKFKMQDIHSLEEALKFTRDLLPIYDRMAELLSLPRGEFLRQYGEFSQKIKGMNPIADLLLPLADKLRDAQDRHDARLALFRAAIAVVRGGPDVLKEIRDPFGDGPFAYRRLKSGFELTSKLALRGGQISLKIGEGE